VSSRVGGIPSTFGCGGGGVKGCYINTHKYGRLLQREKFE
jgi:hypothetical protein